MERDAELELERLIRKRYQALYEIVRELGRQTDFDTLCRRIVELGRERLGFERLGLWFYGELPHTLYGSFGTDDQGQTRDERGIRNAEGSLQNYREHMTANANAISFQKLQTVLPGEADAENADAAAAAFLWNGEERLGVLFADNLIYNNPLTSEMEEVLTLYAGMVGSLCAHLRTANSLREQEQRYRQAIRMANGIVYELDFKSNKYIYLDDSIVSVLGYPREAYLDLLLWARVGKLDRLRGNLRELTIAEATRRFREGHEPFWLADYRCTTASGEIRFLSDTSVLIRDDKGNAKGCLGILQDITDRRQSEAALSLLNETLELRVVERTSQLEQELDYRRQVEATLRESESRLDLAMRATGLALWDINEQTQEIYRSPRYVEMLGYTTNELDPLTLQWSELVHPDDEMQARQRWLTHAEQKAEFYSAEFRLRTKDGGYKWILALGRVVERAADGSVIRDLGVHVDIDSRKRGEERIKRLNHDLSERAGQLEIANKELEAFSYSVSHDLRAPIRSIDGFSRLLLENYSDVLDAAGQGYLKRVRAATQRMGSLIDALLELSRVSRSEIHRERVDLSRMARFVADELYRSQPDRDVTFEIMPDLIADADATLIRVVLENLLGNAWKFTSKHSKAKVRFGAKQENETTVYSVQDDGAGFEMEYAAKLFKAFQRLHSEAEFAGTGIGLATVYRIVRRHGGEIWAVGAKEQGATFLFTL